jgi:hypothetical protein
MQKCVSDAPAGARKVSVPPLSPARWNLNAGRALRPIVIRGMAVMAMTGTDWPLVGSALLALALWFGFLLFLLYYSATTMPP